MSNDEASATPPASLDHAEADIEACLATALSDDSLTVNARDATLPSGPPELDDNTDYCQPLEHAGVGQGDVHPTNGEPSSSPFSLGRAEETVVEAYLTTAMDEGSLSVTTGDTTLPSGLPAPEDDNDRRQPLEHAPVSLSSIYPMNPSIVSIDEASAVPLVLVQEDDAAVRVLEPVVSEVLVEQCTEQERLTGPLPVAPADATQMEGVQDETEIVHVVSPPPVAEQPEFKPAATASTDQDKTEAPEYQFETQNVAQSPEPTVADVEETALGVLSVADPRAPSDPSPVATAAIEAKADEEPDSQAEADAAYASNHVMDTPAVVVEAPTPFTEMQISPHLADVAVDVEVSTAQVLETFAVDAQEEAVVEETVPAYVVEETSAPDAPEEAVEVSSPPIEPSVQSEAAPSPEEVVNIILPVISSDDSPRILSTSEDNSICHNGEPEVRFINALNHNCLTYHSAATNSSPRPSAYSSSRRG